MSGEKGISSRRESIAVLGAGGWGTALAILLLSQGYDVRLWARREEAAHQIRTAGENAPYLPGVKIPPGLFVSASLDEALEGVSYVVLTVPSRGMEALSKRLRAPLKRQPNLRGVISGTKGIDPNSLELMSEIVIRETEMDASRVAVLSGPSFAAEVARKTPTAVVAASSCPAFADEVQEVFMNSYFRVYVSADVSGVQLGGALKNVYAIGAGLLDGLGLGHNARAAFMTRALAELSRLAVATGASPATVSGLSGAGDLFLTCTGPYSRNRWCGTELAKGRTLSEIVASTPMVIEGASTTIAARRLCLAHEVDMPIAMEIHQVLYSGKAPLDAIACLMNRAKKSEL